MADNSYYGRNWEGRRRRKKNFFQRDGEIGVEEDKNEKMCDEKIQSELGYFVII